jgi:CorA-like Mg2+ transporter protein
MTPPPSGLANAAGSLRREMAAASSSICQISPTRCQARSRLYRDGRLELEGFPVADISDYLVDGSVTIWLDLCGSDHDDLAVLSEEFGLHPLAVEAALRPSQRPKLDRYGSHLLLTAYGARLDAGTGELATSEIAAFITSQALITVRQDDGLDIDAVAERWDESPDLAQFGVGYLLSGCWTTSSMASSRRSRAWMTAWRSWRTGCSTTFRGAWRSSGGASSCARAWCCSAGS